GAVLQRLSLHLQGGELAVEDVRSRVADRLLACLECAEVEAHQKPPNGTLLKLVPKLSPPDGAPTPPIFPSPAPGLTMNDPRLPRFLKMPDNAPACASAASPLFWPCFCKRLEILLEAAAPNAPVELVAPSPS